MAFYVGLDPTWDEPDTPYDFEWENDEEFPDSEEFNSINENEE